MDLKLTNSGSPKGTIKKKVMESLSLTFNSDTLSWDALTSSRIVNAVVSHTECIIHTKQNEQTDKQTKIEFHVTTKLMLCPSILHVYMTVYITVYKCIQTIHRHIQPSFKMTL